MGIKDRDLELAPTEIEKELCLLTKKAFNLYFDGFFDDALIIYEDLVLRFDDGLSKAMVTQCRQKSLPKLT